MDDWRKEFQYLLDRKILSRDELAYLFGQIKSIIDNETKALQNRVQSWHSEFVKANNEIQHYKAELDKHHKS